MNTGHRRAVSVERQKLIEGHSMTNTPE